MTQDELNAARAAGAKPFGAALARLVTEIIPPPARWHWQPEDGRTDRMLAAAANRGTRVFFTAQELRRQFKAAAPAI